MNELREQESGVFIVADDAPLFVVPFDRDGKEEVLYATDDAAADRALGHYLQVKGGGRFVKG